MISPAIGAEVERIKASVPLAALIGEALPLRRSGRHMIARCPFHGEKTPSFWVYRDHYHCFGCGAHGDVFTWLMRARAMSFREAMTYLEGYSIGAE